MKGEFISVWPETWEAIWLPLGESDAAPPSVFCELYRDLSNAFATSISEKSLIEIINDQQRSREAFEDSVNANFTSEVALISFLETAFATLDDMQGDELSNLYFERLSEFIDKYSLGYSLRRPCTISPTLPGMFADLMTSVKTFTETDEHLSALYRAHDEAIRDLCYGATEDRIKTCIGKQINLMEAIAATSDSVTAQTLGDMCSQLKFWPHRTIQDSLNKLYGFASNYPGIRHAGNPASKIRDVDTRDLAALSILLMGYSHYLTSALQTNLPSLLSKQSPSNTHIFK